MPFVLKCLHFVLAKNVVGLFLRYALFILLTVYGSRSILSIRLINPLHCKKRRGNMIVVRVKLNLKGGEMKYNMYSYTIYNIGNLKMYFGNWSI